MTISAWITLLVIALTLTTLIFNVMEADIALFLAVIVLLLSGIISPSEAFSGFANEGVITIAALFIVVGAIRHQGSLKFVSHLVLGKGSTLKRSLLRMMASISVMSGFLNNTPIVSFFTPLVKSWSLKKGIPPSKMLIPLSYAAVFGGMCTLIGTSTNIVVASMMEDATKLNLSMFDFAIVGIPVAIVGILYTMTIGLYLLPDTSQKEDYLIKEPEDVSYNGGKMKLTVATMLVMVITAALGWLPMVVASTSAAGFLLLMRVITAQEARQAIDWQVIILVAAAFGLAEAVENTGLANILASKLVVWSELFGPAGAIAALFFATNILTSIISNTAAAALIVPIAVGVAHQLSLGPEPLALTVAIAASAGFATPIGYQTHLLVYGPGGYQFKHFLKIGLPLNLLIMMVTVSIISLVW